MRKYTITIWAAACMLMSLQPLKAQNTSPYWSLAGNSNATTTSKLGTTNGVSLRFYANNVQRMLIGYGSGNVSIGTTTLDARLTVNAATGSNILLGQLNGTTKLRAASNGGLAIGSGSTPPTNGLYVAGNVGIGTASATNKLTILGNGIYTTAAQISNGGLQVLNNWSTGDESVGIYAEGGTGVSGSGMTGVYGSGMTGVQGIGYMGVTGEGSSGGAGVSGFSPDGNGVNGSSNDASGVYGESTSSFGGDFTSASNWGIRATTTSGTYAGVFYGKVWSSGGYVTSDKNLKQNVTEFSQAMTLINKLKPRYYAFTTDAKYAFLHLEKGNHYGLLAQDVEEVLPNLVTTSDHQVPKPVKVLTAAERKKTMHQQLVKEPTETISLKGVNYVELIPIVIKGLQEQDQANKDQNVLIEKLVGEIADLKKQLRELRGGTNTITSAGSLSQNTPNPARTSTRISYTLPSGNGRAQLRITDAAGKLVKITSLNASGSTDLNTSSFSSGVYTYTLLLNGVEQESKKMLIAH